MRILLTAFEPFDESGLNSSLEGCRRFLDRFGAEWDVRFQVLPVRYGEDTVQVEAALAAGPVDLLLHTGQAGSAREIHVERLAVNVRYADDLPGDGTEQGRIDPEGPAALFSTLPVDELAASIREAGVPARVSNHAGIYLCNHVLYRSLQRSPTSPLVGFLHIPPLPEQVQPGSGFSGMTPDQTAKGLRAVLHRLGSHFEIACPSPGSPDRRHREREGCRWPCSLPHGRGSVAARLRTACLNAAVVRPVAFYSLPHGRGSAQNSFRRAS